MLDDKNREINESKLHRNKILDPQKKSISQARREEEVVRLNDETRDEEPGLISLYTLNMRSKEKQNHQRTGKEIFKEQR